MSLTDDVVGEKLPTGPKFQAKVGAGNVKSKLYTATRYGALKNLAKHQPLINEIATKRQDKIRAGKYTRDMRQADFREAIKSADLSTDDKKDLKAILEHWGRGEVDKKPNVAGTKKSSEAKQRLKAAQKIVRPAPVRELPDFLKNRGSVSINKNPWSATGNQKTNNSLGGSISSGFKQSNSFRKPTLLK